MERFETITRDGTVYRARAYAELTDYELRCMARSDAPFFEAAPTGSSRPVAHWSLDSAITHAVVCCGIGHELSEVWARQTDGTYSIVSVQDRSNGGDAPTGWHYFHGPAIPTGWFSPLPDPETDAELCEMCGTDTGEPLEEIRISDASIGQELMLAHRSCWDAPDPAAMFHYDVRLVCDVTGELEATEDNGYQDRSRAFGIAARLNDGHARHRYVVVACDRPGADPIHDVDVAYHRHLTVHQGYQDTGLDRWVGVPRAFEWERPASELAELAPFTPAERAIIEAYGDPFGILANPAADASAELASWDVEYLADGGMRFTPPAAPDPIAERRAMYLRRVQAHILTATVARRCGDVETQIWAAARALRNAYRAAGCELEA